MKVHAAKIGWRILTIMLIAVCLFSGVRLIKYHLSSLSDQKTNEDLQRVFHSADDTLIKEKIETESEPADEKTIQSYQYIAGSVLPSLKNLLYQNHDLVGWLQIPGGIVDLPVVYRDNSYYLTHDFYGRKSDGGTLFLDEKHPFLADTQYLVIHGHNMQDGSMFGLLAHYRRKGYMEKHPTVILSTLYREDKYEVIGVLEVPVDPQKEGYVPYIGMRKFSSEEQFDSFMDMVKENALYWKKGAVIDSSDAFLALSTCYEEMRVVVMCRRKS